MSCSIMPTGPIGKIQGTHGREGGGESAAFEKLCESLLLVVGMVQSFLKALGGFLVRAPNKN